MAGEYPGSKELVRAELARKAPGNCVSKGIHGDTNDTMYPTEYTPDCRVLCFGMTL